MYIITDMTDFNNGKVCMAMTDSKTGTCIRPLPYLTLTDCQNQGLMPGRVVEIEKISQIRRPDPPHFEDRFCKFKATGYAPDFEFKSALSHGCYENGFGTPTPEKFLPYPNDAKRSLITYFPERLCLVSTQYGLKANVDGRRFLPIKDLRYCHPSSDLDLIALNLHIREVLDRDKVYLRLGLTRPLKSGEAQKCYIQVTGIYTFPIGQGVP